MRVLVTGGAGFIGSNFVRHLLASVREVEVINLDLLTYAGSLENLRDVENDPRYRFVQADIADPDAINRLFAEAKPDTVVNFAAESHVDRSITGPAAFIRTNIFGTFTLLEAARAAYDGGKGAFSRFLHVSTDEVYGTLAPDDPAFSETTPYAPNSPYSASKASSDHLVRAYHHTYGLPVVTTNCSNNYGPFQYPEKLIPLMILNGVTGKNLPIYGDGGQVRDWLYVEDHCDAILQVLLRGRSGETYNVGGLNEKRNIEVVHGIIALLDELHPRKDGQSHSAQITHVKDRPGHDRRYAIDARKIQGELAWNPRQSFESGLRRTVEWYLTHQNWVNGVMTRNYAEWMALNYENRDGQAKG